MDSGQDNKVTTDAQTSPQKKQNLRAVRHRFKKPLVLVAGILVLLLLGGAGYWLVQNRNKPHASVKCSDDVLLETIGRYSPSKWLELKPIAEKVQKIPDYQKDPNCLYIVVNYYIVLADSKNASIEMDKLVKVYDTKKGFSPKLGAKPKTIASMQSDIESLNTINEQVKKNTLLAPNQ